MDNSPKAKIAQTIAEKIEAVIRETDIVYLPPMRTLSKKFGVSVTSIHSAINSLKKKNILDVYQGGRISVVGRADSTILLKGESKKSVDKIYDLIKKKIVNGSCKMGHQLPKVSYIAIAEHVSHHAVTGAYRRLEADNLAYKEGRLWFAGPKAKRSPNVSVLCPPVILVLQNHEGFWSYMAKRPFFEAFCRSFQNEVEVNNVQLVPVFFQSSDSLHVIGPGGDAVFDYIRKLDTRYMGTLIVNAEKEVDDFKRWIRNLSLLKRPVVWFDRLKENPPLDSTSRYFVRCHEAEHYAVSLALEQLISLGHRKIAFPVFVDEPWIMNRKSLIQQELKRQCPEAQLFCGDISMNVFASDNLKQQRDVLDKLSKSSFDFVKTALEYIEHNAQTLFENVPQSIVVEYKKDKLTGIASFLHYAMRNQEVLSDLFLDKPYLPWLIILTPFCYTLLTKSAATAIIAPNDMIAHKLYLWLKATKVSVPREISLLSFDNHWFLQDLPITSVDFGYGYLGFAAFHSIVQDVSIKKGVSGDVAAAPRIVHRGTLGIPAKETFSISYSMEPLRVINR